VVACGCALIVGRRWRSARQKARWDRQTLLEVLWWAAVALALRSVFEPVMVAYYLWPVLALSLITASRSWSRLLATSLSAVTLTVASQVPWQSAWAWWAPMIVLLALTILFARVPLGTNGAQSV
jgi:hypothetical protein